MALCMDCNQEMTTAASCTIEVVHLAGVPYPVIRATRHCSDCGVQRGGAHHLGCDWAKCPRCRWQMLCCGCHFDEYGPREDDDDDDWPDDDWPGEAIRRLE